MMIYNFLCDQLQLDESHRVTKEIIASQSVYNSFALIV